MNPRMLKGFLDTIVGLTFHHFQEFKMIGKVPDGQKRADIKLTLNIIKQQSGIDQPTFSL